MESFTKTDILNQVERICKYPDIKSKKLICRFLRFIVDETISGRGDQLKGYSIGVNVFGKDADFDPEHDSLVRIHAGRLRRSLRIYYLDKGKNDQIHIEIPKGGYQPVFTLIEAKNTSYLPDNIHGHFNPREPSVVVLPFKNLTGNPHKEYFSFGFSEELSVELTKYEDLNILNCWHRPGNDSSEDLYKKYGARYLIDGSVQLNDQNLHILVKLVDTISGKQVWAERYSRSLSVKSLIDIQEEIADTVAKTIGSEVGILFHELTLESNRIKSENLQVFDAS